MNSPAKVANTNTRESFVEGKLAACERIHLAYDAMTEAEKAEFHAWENKFVTGDCTCGTHDWPGWANAVARISN